MKNLGRALLACSALFLVADTVATVTYGRSFFGLRSTAFDWSRRVFGDASVETGAPDADELSGYFSGAFEYQRSADADKLAKYMFFNGKDSMEFSTTAGGNDVDVYSGNFVYCGNATLTAQPLVQQFTWDPLFRLNLDNVSNGLFFTVGVPITYMTADMKLEVKSEVAKTLTIASYDHNGVAGNINGPTELLTALKGEYTGYDLEEEMAYAKFDGELTKTRLAGVTVELGYNFINKEEGYLGGRFVVIAPTGNDTEAKYVFEPIVGGGKHWGVGCGGQAKWRLWESDTDQSVTIYLNGVMASMLSRNMLRTFDLKKNGRGSRYLIFKEFNSTGAYAHKLHYGPNILTLKANSKYDLEGEFVAMMRYRNGGFGASVGFDLWGRGAEKLSLVDSITGNKYAPKNNTDASGGAADYAAPTAQISGKTTAADVDMRDGTNLATKTISTGGIDLESAAAPHTKTYRLFGGLDYTWEENDWTPMIALGAMYQWSGVANNSANQWGVVIKGGLSFS